MGDPEGIVQELLKVPEFPGEFAERNEQKVVEESTEGYVVEEQRTLKNSCIFG